LWPYGVLAIRLHFILLGKDQFEDVMDMNVSVRVTTWAGT